MFGVFDKVVKKISSRPRYNCEECKDTGYISVKVSPLDNNSVNTFGKDVSLKTKIPCTKCDKGKEFRQL